MAIHSGARWVIAGAEAELVHPDDDGSGVDGFNDVDVFGVVGGCDFGFGC